MDDTTTWPQQLENLEDVDRSDDSLRAWVSERIHRLEADGRRSADTHLVKLDLPAGWDIQLYLKDESTHASGSLKHRLARSLFLFALVNGQLRPGMPVIEASSGSTAVSEAHVARMLAIPFVAVIPRGTSTRKIALIEAAAWSLPRGRGRGVDEPGGAAAGRRAGRAVHGPVHPRRAGHRLARQQLDRRQRPVAAGARTASGATLDRGGRRHRRDECDLRAAAALPQSAHRAVRGRRRGLRLLRGLGAAGPDGHHRAGLPHRGDRPHAGRAELRAGGGGSDDPGARCGLGRRGPLPLGAPGPHGSGPRPART